MNVLHNAVKFTPDGGIVTVSGSEEEKGDFVIIQVADNGIGIPPGRFPDSVNDFTGWTRRDPGNWVGPVWVCPS
jgi:signal transduction histidine kinase